MRLMSELMASLFVSEKMEKDDIENLKEKDALQSVLDSLPPSFRKDPRNYHRRARSIHGAEGARYSAAR
jgi:hypothetical protein